MEGTGAYERRVGQYLRDFIRDSIVLSQIYKQNTELKRAWTRKKATKRGSNHGRMKASDNRVIIESNIFSLGGSKVVKITYRNNLSRMNANLTKTIYPQIMGNPVFSHVTTPGLVRKDKYIPQNAVRPWGRGHLFSLINYALNHF